MAKDTRIILSGVIVGGGKEGEPQRTYLPGEEDELDDVLTVEQAKRLYEMGAIVGNWKSKPKKGAE